MSNVPANANDNGAGCSKTDQVKREVNILDDAGEPSVDMTGPIHQICAGNPNGFHRYLFKHGTEHELMMPSAPLEQCSQELQSRISDLCQHSQQGISLVETIERSAEFRHPRSYERLVLRLGIDASGSNFPKEVFNPHELDSSVNYENLVQARAEYNNNEEKLRNVLIPIKDLANLVKRAKEIKEITMQKKSPLPASFGAARTTPLSIAVPGLVSRKFQGTPGSRQRPGPSNDAPKSPPKRNAPDKSENEPQSSKH